MFFLPQNLLIFGKPVHLQCVFHSIRFKVNKGWSKALLLFYVYTFAFSKISCVHSAELNI